MRLPQPVQWTVLLFPERTRINLPRLPFLRQGLHGLAILTSIIVRLARFRSAHNYSSSVEIYV